MVMASILELLQNTLSHDQRLLQEASVKLDQFSQQDFGGYLGLLCQELVNEQNPSHIRNAAALAIKNTLSARDQARKEELVSRWFTTDINIRVQVKAMLLQVLSSADLRAAMSSGQVIAAIAEIELPRNEWPDLISILMQNSHHDNVNLKKASLQTIGYVCETIDPNVLKTQANAILTAVAQGARKEETKYFLFTPNLIKSNEIRFVAMQALYNSLQFISANFENPMERNYIMQVVCEGTQSPEENVQVASYQCLVRIMSLYYDKMPDYMQQALYHLTILGMKNENPNIALQAIEFWSTVCEVEVEIEETLEDAALSDIQTDKISYHFAEGAVKEIAPILLWLLTKKEDDEDEDEWNVSMAAATCLGLFANVVQDNIVQHVITFVEAHIKNSDWKFREAAVMAFGSILEGPSHKFLVPLCIQALRTLCEMVADPVVAVKDTAAWTLGRVCERLADSISAADMTYVVQALIFGLNDSPRVGANCAWAIINLSENLGSDLDPDAPSFILSPYFEGLIGTLMAAGERSGQNSNFRASVFEAVSSLVTNAPQDCLPTITQLTTGVLELLQKTVASQNQIVGADEKREHIEFQANLCGVLTSIIRKLRGQIAPLSDQIMQLLLTIMSGAAKSSTLLEDAFLTVGAITAAVESQFARYMDSFTPFLYAALQNHEEHAMCSIAIGTIGDICRALNDGILPYCDNIMNLLMTNIQSTVLHRNVKPVILSCFGDLALAIGGHFEKYLAIVMQVLMQAATSTVTNPDQIYDYEMIDYFSVLRESVLEAYVGIVQGLKSSQKVYLINDQLTSMFQFMAMCYNDPERNEEISRSMAGLLGDIAEAYPRGELRQFYQAPWIEALIKELRSNRSGMASSRETARWARECIKLQA